MAGAGIASGIESVCVQKERFTEEGLYLINSRALEVNGQHLLSSAQRQHSKTSLTYAISTFLKPMQFLFYCDRFDSPP